MEPDGSIGIVIYKNLKNPGQSRGGPDPDEPDPDGPDPDGPEYHHAQACRNVLKTTTSRKYRQSK